MNYEFHEVANIFPMMSETEFSGLVEDIRKNGQREPIWLHQEKIVDGRNRYNACSEIGVEPVVDKWDGKGSLVDFVMSMNFHRRQLSTSQRAMVGAKISHIFKEDAKRRSLANQNNNTAKQTVSKETVCEQGRSSAKAAKMVGVSQGSVDRAISVINNAIPEVVEAVKSGQVTVTKADTIAKLPKESQPEILKKVIANEPIKPKPVIQPEPISEPAYMEGAEVLQEILENISMQLGLLIGQAETELLNLPKSTVKNIKYQVGASVDGIHKCAERLEISLKMSNRRV